MLAGDHVRLVSAKRTFVDPWAEQVAASKGERGAADRTAAARSGGQPIDHAELARVAWQDTLGQPLERRIARWTELLAADPQTPYRKAIETRDREPEVRRCQGARGRAREARRRTRRPTRDPRIAQLAAQLDVGPRAAARSDRWSRRSSARCRAGRSSSRSSRAARRASRDAWLYVRPDGAPGFTRIELARDGDAYLRGTIDGALVTRREASSGTSRRRRPAMTTRRPVLGSQDDAARDRVDDVVAEAPIEQGRTHIDGHFDYVDFDGSFDDGFDQYYQAELDFTYRFFEAGLRGAARLRHADRHRRAEGRHRRRSDDSCLDETGAYQCERVTFSYVYTEVELRVRPNVALMLRPQAGLLTTDTMRDVDRWRSLPRRATSPAASSSRASARAAAFGSATSSARTSCSAPASPARVGTLLEAAYHWLPNPVVPVQITVQVTDQPVPEDFGVRLIGDVGLRKLSWFYPSLRVSYQARDIDHSGISGGFALNFDW